MTMGFPNRAVQRTDPAIGAIAIDYALADQDIEVPARRVYVATAGDLKVDMMNGDTVTFVGLLAGHIYDIAVKKVYQVGSTAAGLILS